MANDILPERQQIIGGRYQILATIGEVSAGEPRGGGGAELSAAEGARGVCALRGFR